MKMAFVSSALHVLNRSTSFTEDVDYRVFSYACDNLGPRPESYREDVELAKTIEDEEEVQEFYLHMKAGAESGWDYSTRWMIDHKVQSQHEEKEKHPL